MPRFFLDIDDGDRVAHDEDCQEMDNSETARAEAVCVLPDVAKWVLPNGDRRTFTSVVRDANGKLIYRATLTLQCERLD